MRPSDFELLGRLKKHATWRKLSRLQDADTWRVLSNWDTNLGATVEQMLKCQRWLSGSLVCTICYPCASIQLRHNEVPGIWVFVTLCSVQACTVSSIIPSHSTSTVILSCYTRYCRYSIASQSTSSQVSTHQIRWGAWYFIYKRKLITADQGKPAETKHSR